MVLISVILSACSFQRARLVVNPYENIEWNKTNQFKANFHMHTTNSDGSLTGDYVVDTYARNGYSIITITDHDILTWPWSDFSKIKSDWKDRDPDSMKVLAFPGIELDDPHHRGMYFAWIHGGCYDLDSTFQQARDSLALCIMNHPGRYWKIKKQYNPKDVFSPEWYIEYLKKYPEIVGIEVYNRPNDAYPYDRILWDELLTRSMPFRPVWGFANDDMHGKHQMMGNYQFMLMEELSVPALKAAMKEGAFYCSNEPGHSGAALAPRIDSISVNRNRGKIKVFARDYNSIRWISGVIGSDSTRTNNVIVEDEQSFKFKRFDKPYIRFELRNDKGVTLSQPFGFLIDKQEGYARSK